MIMLVEPFLIEHERLAKPHADLHRQVAHHLISRFAAKLPLLGAPKFSAVLQSKIMLTKKWTQFVDVNVHVEPQPIDGER